MPDRGKLVVAAILVVALGLAVFAWYWRWQQGHRAAEFWGAEASQLIRGAPKAELLVLQPRKQQESASGEPDSLSPSDDSELAIAGQSYVCVTNINLANSPGLIHARHSLTEDASFVWDRPTEDCQIEWTHAMRLSQNGHAAVLAFDFKCHRIVLVEQHKTITVVPRISEGFQRIFERAVASQDLTAPRQAERIR